MIETVTEQHPGDDARGLLVSAAPGAGPAPVCSSSTSPVPALGELGAGELSDLIAAHTMAVRRAEAVVLELGCAWADRFPELSQAPHLSAAMRSAAEDYAADVGSVAGTGGVGTPEVSVFAIAEFAVLRRVSIGAGHALIADALDLRHRLPGLHRLAAEGAVTVSMARRAARETRHLTVDQAAEVDSWLAEVAAGIGWSRFCTVVEAAVIEADPERAAERAAAAARAQDVWTRRDPEGLATVVARIEAGDAAVLWAMIGRIADILAVRLPGMAVGQRRARALGLLARPLQALALLVAHAEDPDGVDLLDDLDGTAEESRADGHVPARFRSGPDTGGYDDPDSEHPHGPEPADDDVWPVTDSGCAQDRSLSAGPAAGPGPTADPRRTGAEPDPESAAGPSSTADSPPDAGPDSTAGPGPIADPGPAGGSGGWRHRAGHGLAG